MKTTTFGAALISLILISCATYDPKTGTYSKDNPPPNISGNSPVVGVIGGILGIIQLSSYSSDQAKSRGISGRCIEESKGVNRPCENTYLEIKDMETGKSMKTWIDETGTFGLRTPNGKSYSLQAFKEIEGSQLRHSDLLVITTPREVRISIRLQEKP